MHALFGEPGVAMLIKIIWLEWNSLINVALVNENNKIG